MNLSLTFGRCSCVSFVTSIALSNTISCGVLYYDNIVWLKTCDLVCRGRTGQHSGAPLRQSVRYSTSVFPVDLVARDRSIVTGRSYPADVNSVGCDGGNKNWCYWLAWSCKKVSACTLLSLKNYIT